MTLTPKTVMKVISKYLRYVVKINIFCEKTTVLAEKVFHPAAGEAQLKAFVTCLSLHYQVG